MEILTLGSGLENNKTIIMKMTTVLLSLLLFVFHAGCKKDPVIKDPPKPIDTTGYQTRLDIKWIQWYTADSVGSYYLDPYFTGDYVAFCTRSLLDKGQLGFAIFHAQTGDWHPVWKNLHPDIIEGTSDDIPDWRICGPNRDIAVLTTRNRLFAWNLSDGQQLWKHHHSPNFGLSKLSQVGGVPYHTYYPGNYAWSRLVRFNPETGTKEDLVTIPWKNNYEVVMYPPSEWVSPVNDTILLFAVNGINYPLNKGSLDIYAFNLTTRTIEWEVPDIAPNGYGAIRPPLVIGNKVVFQGTSSIHCFDISSGALLWEKSYLNPLRSFTCSRNFHADGRIFCRSTESILAFDLQTGTELWETSIKINNLEGGSIDYYQGNLFFTASDRTHPNYARSLFCIEAGTGKLIWKDPGPNEHGGMAFGIIIDQSTGYLYATDAYRMMCIDLNTTPK
jgi:outer membrane protein assembly factor BamB